MNDLFSASIGQDAPLAARMRPRTLDEVMGQAHLVGPGGFLRRVVARGRIPSMLFWGPPGTGKTTLAEVLSRTVSASFERLSAVLAGVKDIRKAIAAAERRRGELGMPTILFVDEIHRFNKAQQDALLPHVERGTVTLIGATTENPSFEVNAALLSRCRVLVTKPLSPADLTGLIDRALATPDRGLGEHGLAISTDAREMLLVASGGDARKLLTSLEVAAELCLAEAAQAAAALDQVEPNQAEQDDAELAGTDTDDTGPSEDDQGAPEPGAAAGDVDDAALDAAESDAERAAEPSSAAEPRIDTDHIEQAVARRVVLYDKAGEQHYDIISAFIKSMRGSDPDAACHYLARMLEAGEDPRFLLRRMVIFASEDIGLADPNALQTAVAALHAFELVGLPEGVLAMTQAAIYLACAPKSNAVIKAYGRARRDLSRHATLPVPMHIRNAPTAMMKSMGYGQNYRYPHNTEGNFVVEDYLPEPLRGQRYYEPSENGIERRIKDRLERLRAMAGIDKQPENRTDVPHHY